MSLSFHRLFGRPGELVRSAFPGSSVGGQEALASHLPVCSQVHSRPSCALRCIAGNSFPRFPLPTGLLVCWTLGRLWQKTKRGGKWPWFSSPDKSPCLNFHSTVLFCWSTPPWPGSPQRGSADPALLFCPSSLLLLSSRVSHHPLASWPFHLCKEFPVFYFN